jgi:hypothetical protein
MTEELDNIEHPQENGVSMTCKKLKEDRKAASVCKYKRKEVVNILM